MSDAAGLLDPAFVRELETLERRLSTKARSAASGEHRGTKRGGSAEFCDHRAYEPGDDLRRIDWMAYARTGAPVVKVFRTDEDAIVRILVDTSRSMASGTPSKLDVALRFSAATAYLALAATERTETGALSAGAVELSRPVRGKQKIASVLRNLVAMRADGKTELARSIELCLKKSHRPGMLVVLSDFLDPGAVTHAMARAAVAGHDIALVHVLARDEISPPWQGDVALVDDETGDIADLTLDPEVVRAYQGRLALLVEGLRAVAKRAGGVYVRLATDEPWQAAVRRFVARTIDGPLEVR